MKKYSIFLMAALALGFTACDDVQDVVSIPQSNPQETIMAADGVTVAAGESLAAGSVNLQSLKDNAAKVAALNIVEVKDLPANQSVKVVMELSDVEDFSNVKVLETEVAENVAYVAPSVWNNAHLELYGKNPMERTSYVRYALYAVNGSTEIRLGYDAETQSGVYYNASAINVTPLDPEVWIEEAYYLVLNGDKANAIAMTGSGDRFDNPKFSAMATVADGAQWQVYPQSAIDGDAVVYGPDPETASEAGTGLGNLVEGASGTIAVAGDYVFSVNMEEKTYQCAAAIKDLYVGRNGGSVVASRNPLVVTTEDYVTYQGYIYPKDGSFRFFTAQKSTSNSYGMAADAVATSNGYNYEVALEYPSKNQITLGLPVAAMPMWATLDANALTLKAYAIEGMSIIGSVKGNWDTDVVLTSTDNIVWTATDVELAAGEFKFRANKAWDIDFGGTLDNIQCKGGNMVLEEAGVYDVTLDFSVIPYTCTLTKK